MGVFFVNSDWIYQQFSPSPIGMQTLDSAASSANSWALASNLKSAFSGISVFHSFKPPNSFSEAFTVGFSADEIAIALVAAKNIAIELFWALKDSESIFFILSIKKKFFYLMYKMIQT